MDFILKFSLRSVDNLQALEKNGMWKKCGSFYRPFNCNNFTENDNICYLAFTYLREFEIAPLLLFGALIDRRLQQGVRAYVLKQYMAHQNNHIRHGFKHEN